MTCFCILCKFISTYIYFRFEKNASHLHFNVMERNLRRLQYKVFPKQPETCNEITTNYTLDNVNKLFAYTIGDNLFLFYKGLHEDKSRGFAFCVFASDNIINLINEHISIAERNYLMDATFKVCPVGPFAQLLIIYLEYCNDVSRIEWP